MSGVALRMMTHSRVAWHGLSQKSNALLASDKSLKRIALRHFVSSTHLPFCSSIKYNRGSQEPALVGIRLTGQTVTTVAKDLPVSGGARGTFSLWDLYIGTSWGSGGDGIGKPVSCFAERWGHIAIGGGNFCGIWPRAIEGVARRYLFQHDAPVNCVDLAEEVCVTGTDAAACYLYDLKNGELRNTLQGHVKKVTALALEGENIVSGSADNTCRVWRLHRERSLHVLQHTSEISTLALQGKILVSGARDGLVRAWNIETGKAISDLVGHSAAITTVQIDEEELVAFTSSADGTAKIWDLMQGKCLATLSGHKAKINCLKADGPFVATGSDDKTAKVWSKKTGDLMFDMPELAPVTCLQLRGTSLVTGMANGTWSHTELPSPGQA